MASPHLLAQFSTTRLFSALKKAFRPDGHHPRAASGSQISCVQPCLRAVDGSDGRVLRGEGDSGKEILDPSTSTIRSFGNGADRTRFSTA